MAAVADMTGLIPPHRRQTSWRGRSGRAYALANESLDRFTLVDDTLHLIAKGNLVLWVGSSEDLVADPMSRTRFRLALDCADRIYRVYETEDEATRLATIWDLEGAEPDAELSAA